MPSIPTRVPAAIAALGVGAVLALAPVALGSGSTGCTMTPGADCQDAHMPSMAGGMSMAGKNMSGADMRGADMRGMNMSGMNLSGADMRGANMNGANMTGANLNGANLSGTTLRNTKLNKAKMRKSRMTGMRLVGVRMNGATITNTDMRGTRFIGGGMTNSQVTGSNFGPMPKRSAKKGQNALDPCLGVTAPGFYGKYVGLAWQQNYNLNGTVFTNTNLHCATFSNVSLWNVTFVNSNVTYSHYYGDQNGSQSIAVLDSDFSSASFNDRFWAPAVVRGATISGAYCAPVNTDATNGEWGHYSAVDPRSTYDHPPKWVYGFVVETGQYGSVTYASQPVPVTLTDSQEKLITARGYARPWVTATNTNCAVYPTSLN